jgi:hypothetical protein
MSDRKGKKAYRKYLRHDAPYNDSSARRILRRRTARSKSERELMPDYFASDPKSISLLAEDDNEQGSAGSILCPCPDSFDDAGENDDNDVPCEIPDLEIDHAD